MTLTKRLFLAVDKIFYHKQNPIKKTKELLSGVTVIRDVSYAPDFPEKSERRAENTAVQNSPTITPSSSTTITGWQKMRGKRRLSLSRGFVNSFCRFLDGFAKALLKRKSVVY
ncbi:MAG: hypothetical protein IJ735_02345 [Clostridia bacterium]|nr:hypothetical protein [Clostridia bacterium]